MDWLWGSPAIKPEKKRDAIKRINTMLVTYGEEIDDIELKPFMVSQSGFCYHFVHVVGYPIIHKIRDYEPTIDFKLYNNVLAYHKPSFLGETDLYPNAHVKYTLNF